MSGEWIPPAQPQATYEMAKSITILVLARRAVVITFSRLINKVWLRCPLRRPPQTVTDRAMSGVFDLSPDGKFVAFAMLEHAGEHKEKLAVVSTDSGQVLKRLDFERPRFGWCDSSRMAKRSLSDTRQRN